MEERTAGTYDGLKIENQLCFPLYACARQVIRKYKPFLDELDLSGERDGRHGVLVDTAEHRGVGCRHKRDEQRLQRYRDGEPNELAVEGGVCEEGGHS